MVRRDIEEMKKINRLMKKTNGHANFPDLSNDDEFGQKFEDFIANANSNDCLSDEENDSETEHDNMNMIENNNLDAGFGKLSISDFLLEDNELVGPEAIEGINHGAVFGFAEPNQQAQVVAIASARYNYYRSINCIAIVHCVLDGSPADIAGIREKDKILEFGPVDADNFRDIYQLHKIVRQSVGRPIKVLVQRKGVNRELSVIPRHWEKSGLIGCQIMSCWGGFNCPNGNS